MAGMTPLIGTAGWTIPRESAPRFPGEGTQLERYALQLNAVEIDSSFYHSHLPQTYARWAACTPQGFRFAIKVPKEVTHLRRLMDVAPLERFTDETSTLGEKLGTWLLQLPPGLAYNPVTVERFFERMRTLFDGNVACEPRHSTWFTPEVDRMLSLFRVARVAADPAISPLGTRPGGWSGLVYYRLHGSPRMYTSAYPAEFIGAFTQIVSRAAASAPVWCIFNNTAEGAAIENAFTLKVLLNFLTRG